MVNSTSPLTGQQFQSYHMRAAEILRKNPFESKSDIAYKILRSDILKGVFKPGDSIPQDLIAQALAMSRTPVKNALSKLLEEGFAERDKQGVFVKRVNISEYVAFCEFRLSLEVGNVFFSTRNASAADLAKIQKSLDKMKAAIDGDKPFRDVLKYDHEFHHLIMLAGKNQFFIKTFEENMERLFFYQVSLLSEHNYPNMIHKHEKILMALQERDEQLAQQQMQNHLIYYVKNMFKL
ncbi:MAG: GntR family transcriptional regulator [Candidatus Scatomorpha sp.]|jgi:DNA-binding GntR family transcriptional regulator